MGFIVSQCCVCGEEYGIAPYDRGAGNHYSHGFCPDNNECRNCTHYEGLLYGEEKGFHKVRIFRAGRVLYMERRAINVYIDGTSQEFLLMVWDPEEEDYIPEIDLREVAGAKAVALMYECPVLLKEV